MSEVPDVLVQQATWAKVAISHVLGTHGGNGSLLWGKHKLATSSMFSGVGYPERALEFISAARQAHIPGMPDLTVPWLSWGVSEIYISASKINLWK